MLQRVTNFLRKRKIERELEDELQASVELLAAQQMRHGASAHER
jgi:hypothetical protein